MTTSIRAMGVPDGSGQYPEWLKVIHKANEIAGGDFFAEPQSTGPWWAGGYAEEYEHARVILRQDEGRTADLVGKDAYGDAILAEAATQLGIHFQEA